MAEAFDRTHRLPLPDGRAEIPAARPVACAAGERAWRGGVAPGPQDDGVAMPDGALAAATGLAARRISGFPSGRCHAPARDAAAQRVGA